MAFKRVIFFFILLTVDFNLCAQHVDEIIGRYENFIGGRNNWSRIKTMSVQGAYEYGGLKFTFTSYAKAPNFYKFIVAQNNKYYAQAFNGKQGWKIDVFNNEKTATLLTGKAALSMANEADVELEEALMGYQDKGHRALLEGTDTIEQKVYFKIRFTKKNGETEFYYFDTQTSELVIKEAISKNPEMQGAWLTTFYSDYRSVDEIKVPFNVVRKLNEQVILIATCDKVVLDDIIEDREFEP